MEKYVCYLSYLPTQDVFLMLVVGRGWMDSGSCVGGIAADLLRLGRYLGR